MNKFQSDPSMVHPNFEESKLALLKEFKEKGFLSDPWNY